MKRIILVCLAALMACTLKAQTPNVDSLVNVLETQKLTNKEKLELYEKICKAYQDYDVGKLIIYSEKGLQLAEKEHDKVMASEFYMYQGAGCYNKGKFDTALIYYGKALELAIETEDKMQEAVLYSRIGNVYGVQDNDIIALEYHQKALLLFENMGKKKQYMFCLINIGSIYASLRNNKQAIHYIEQAKTIAEEIDDIEGKLCYYDLGRIYLEEGDIDKAEYYELEVLEICRTINHKQGEILALQLLANIYSEGKSEYDKAEKYAKECLSVAEEYGEPRLVVIAYNILSSVYLHQGRFADCEVVALKSWHIDSTDLMINTGILSNLVNAYINLGNKDKAMDFFKKFADMIGQYGNENFHNSLAEMEVKYETEKKEMRIGALEKEKTLYMWIIVISIVAALLTFGILFFRYKLNVQKRKQAEQQVKQLEREKQLVAAQALIDGEVAERSRLARDLHDGLGGMLSVVKLNLKDMKGYSILDNLDVGHFNKAMDMLDQSITELRRVAHHIMPESLMRYGLKVSLDDFCRAIPGASFRFFGEDADLDNRLKTLIYRCTYELVNNAVKHANAAHINVQLMIENGLVSLSVHDDGTGFDPEKVTEGAGLENVRVRVASYNGKMSIYSSPGKGAEVSIEIEPS